MKFFSSKMLSQTNPGLMGILCLLMLTGGMPATGFGQDTPACEQADAVLAQYPVKTVLRDVECFVARIKFDVYARLKAIVEPDDPETDIFQQLEELEQFRRLKLQDIEQGGLVQNRLPQVLQAVEQKEQCLMSAQPAHLYERILNKLADDKERLETKQTTDVHILRTYLNNLGEVIERCQQFCKQTKVLISEDEQRQEIKTNFFDSELSNWEIAAVPEECPEPTPTPTPSPTPTATPTPSPTPTPIPPPQPNAKAICDQPGGSNQLRIQIGDLLFIGETRQKDWYWATTMQTGQSGWVAVNCVEALETSTPPLLEADPTFTPMPTPAKTPFAERSPTPGPSDKPEVTPVPDSTTAKPPRFKAKALADYPGGGDRLRIHAGEVLTILGQEQDGWYWAVNQAGQAGWTLAAYIKLLEPQNLPFAVGDAVLVNVQGNWCLGKVLALGSERAQVQYKLYGETQETRVEFARLRPSFQVGERVLGKVHGTWYKATVIERRNGSWRLEYDEGFPDAWVGPNLIKAIE